MEMDRYILDKFFSDEADEQEIELISSWVDESEENRSEFQRAYDEYVVNILAVAKNDYRNSLEEIKRKDKQRRSRRIFSYATETDLTEIDLYSTTSGDCPVPTFYIGRSYNHKRWFNGKMAEVRIWNRALSEEEINADGHFFSVDPATAEGLLAYWKLNGGDGSVIKDYSGNNNHGKSYEDHEIDMKKGLEDRTETALSYSTETVTISAE